MLAKWFGWVRTLALAIRSHHRRTSSRRLRLELLEDRRLLSTLASPIPRPSAPPLVEFQRHEPDASTIKAESRPEFTLTNTPTEPLQSHATETSPGLNKIIEVVHGGPSKIGDITPEKSTPPGGKPLGKPTHLPHHLGKPPPHAIVPTPAKSSEPILRLITDLDDRLTNPSAFSAKAIDALDDVGTESITISAKAPDELDTQETESSTIPTRAIEAKSGGLPSQVLTVAKEAHSSEKPEVNQAEKKLLDTDDGSESATTSAKLMDTKGGGKSSQEPTGEKETLSSENSEGNQPEKPTSKERVESVSKLDLPATMALQSRDETRLHEGTQSSRTETRSDFSKDITPASRRDFHKGPASDADRIFLMTRSRPELTPLLGEEIVRSQVESPLNSVWNVDHFPNGTLISQAELEGAQSLELAGLPGQTILQTGDSSGLQETLLATSPLWGAFFLQSLGRLRPRPTQPTIMVVEGDEDKRDKLVMSFAKQGYLILSAPTTHDAMGLVRAPLSPIDLAVVNLNLPDLSGLHLCTYLRKSNPGLQLIVYSDEAEPAELPQLRKLGVNRFLQNPFTVEELIADVASLLHSSKQEAGGR